MAYVEETWSSSIAVGNPRPKSWILRTIALEVLAVVVGIAYAA